MSTLQQAISDGNVSLLSKCPGIGKKTAERIIIELKDKISLTPNNPASLPINETNTSSSKPADNQIQQDAVAAMMSLGYKLNDADKAVRQAAAKLDTYSVEELIKAALGR